MRTRLALFLITIMLLSACSAGSPTTDQVTTTPEPTATPRPTEGPTATPMAPLVILVTPADMNQAQSKDYQKAVYDLAQAQGYRFVVLNKLTETDMDPTLKIVIDLSPDVDVTSLAAKAPQAQFLAINLPNIKPGGNLSTLGGDNTSIDKVAFMAGYIAAAITQDYHTGLLLRKGSADADTIESAFTAGQQYYCGLCNPFAGPFNSYPLRQDIPDDAKPSQYSAYADILIHKQVDTMFIQPGVDAPELLQYLQTVGVLMIGTQSPTKSVNGWVVTLEPNFLEAMKNVFPDLVAGKGGQEFPAPLSFDDANGDLFSVGKQNNARQILDNLLQGFVSTQPKQ